MPHRYGGDWSLAKDVSRFAFYFDNPEELIRGLEALCEGFRCVKVENRFRSPTVLGWRDVTIILEVELDSAQWGPNARHLSEVQLQLEGYAKAREHAHHHYAVLRKKIVEESHVTDSQMQDAILQSMLDAMEGGAGSGAGQMLERNFSVLQHIYSTCFGELWAAASVKLSRPATLNDRWSFRKDAESSGAARLSIKSKPFKMKELDAKLTKACNLIKSAAVKSPLIQLTVDSVMRKLQIGTWTSLTGKALLDVANAILESSIISKERPSATTALPDNYYMLGYSFTNLRPADILTDLRGAVSLPVLDAVVRTQCSFGPSVHELNMTYGAVKLAGVTDLVEAFELTNLLLDLDFGGASTFGLAEYLPPPNSLKGYQVQQAWVAATTLRQYAWAYAGERANQSGYTADIVNLQQGALLAQRYVLSNELIFVNVSSFSWAFLGMVANYDRATGSSEAGCLVELLASTHHATAASGHGSVAAAEHQRLLDYATKSKTRELIRCDEETGKPPFPSTALLRPAFFRTFSHRILSLCTSVCSVTLPAFHRNPQDQHGRRC